MGSTGRNLQGIGQAGIPHLVADYDSPGYDYRLFWRDRDYEWWAEGRVLRWLLNRVGQVEWLVDFGGGFGRNAVHYLQHAEHAVLIDYSVRNLEAAAFTYTAEIASGRLFLVRADLACLPFVEGAFDMGLLVRVLHHLPQVDGALVEMGRVMREQWLLDVPIKHHLLARVRGLFQGETGQLSSWAPKDLGTADQPFLNFHLAAIRQNLADHGWESELAASMNNFRRWDQALPARLTVALRPLVYGLELIAQRVGRGWWGPSQFVWARRREPVPAVSPDVVSPEALEGTTWSLLAMKMLCPTCHGKLQWSREAASCPPCSRTYPRLGAIWNFVAD